MFGLSGGIRSTECRSNSSWRSHFTERVVPGQDSVLDVVGCWRINQVASNKSSYLLSFINLHSSLIIPAGNCDISFSLVNIYHAD